MPSGGHSNQDWLARWETLAAGEDTVVDRDPHSTIEPARRSGHPVGDHALQLLQQLTRSAGSGEHGAIRLGATLGEGGMGIVHLGTQVALDREVAVKRLRAEHRTDASTLKLLREAWITGSLEHPNIVPVYDLALDSEGHPVIILKKIEGVAWAEVMHDEQLVRRRFRARNLLEWNVSVLMQVCNAVHFAHSRHVVHRDLKPENVMLGEFGEVYVVDWGIAVSTQDDGSGRLPLAAQAHQLAGTPCYMAPEMLGGEEPAVTERSDVFLLGATLHEILTGEPPHRGDTLMDIVRSIMTRRPGEWAETVSPELARICDRAMDHDPDARFESAEQLRLALEGYLQHRGSALLSLEAEERLDQLEQELRAETPHGDPATHREHLYNLFGEARFGFHQALRQWRDNEAAREGLLRATIAMTEYELEQGDPKAASLILAELPNPPEELTLRVEEARVASEVDQARIAELERMGQDLDPRLGQRTRLFVATALGTLWTLTPLASHFYLDGREPPRLASVGLPLLFLCITALFVAWGRDSLTQTLVNRRIIATLGWALVQHLLWTSSAWLADIPLGTAHALLIFTWVSISGMATIYLSSRLWPSVVGYVASFVLAVASPPSYLLGIALGNFVLTVNLIILWWTPIRYTAQERAARNRTDERPDDDERAP